MRKKPVWFVLFACLFMLWSVSAALAADATEFSDVGNDQENAVYIRYLNQKGILNGYSDATFRPQQGLTRAEAAAFVAKVKDLTGGTKITAPFSDVGTDHWSAGHIAAAAEQGYLKGFSDGSFHPDEQLTRAQAVSLLVRLSGQPDSDAKLPLFNDIDSRHWAASSVATALVSGMIALSQDAGSFYPDNAFTRSDLARALAVLLTQDANYYKTELPGSLKVMEGSIELIRDGKVIQLNKNNSSSIYPLDILKSGKNTQADLQYPDGSAILIKENTEITVKASQGRSYIKKTGDLGVAVDWLNIELKKGTIFGALATRYENPAEAQNQTAANLYFDNLPARNVVASLDNYDYLLLADELGTDLPWWETAEQKKVKVQVDMPYGVAAVRGTFWQNIVGPGGQSTTSCLVGDMLLSNSQGAVSLTGGQTTSLQSLSTPPAPPAPLTPGQLQQFSQEQPWLQQTAQNIDRNQGLPPAPPVTSGQVPSQPQSGPSQPGQQTGSVLDTIMGALQQSGSGGTLPVTENPLGGSGGARSDDSSSDDGDDEDDETPTIVTIDDVTVTVRSLEEYTSRDYPETVEVIMSNQTNAQKPVTWYLDQQVETASQLRIPGIVAGYSGTVWLIITVEADEQPTIVEIADVTVTVASLDEYPSEEYPALVEVLMSDDTYTEKSVVWNLEETDDTVPCQLRIPGTVEGYSDIVWLIITIQDVDEIGSLGENIEPSPYEDNSFRIMLEPGADFELPVTASVYLYDDTNPTRAITWIEYFNGEETIDLEGASDLTGDTDLPGLYKYRGTIPGYPEEIVLKIRVLDSEQSAEDCFRIALEGEDPLPETVTVPASENDPPVTLRFIALDPFDEIITDENLYWSADAPEEVSIDRRTGELTINYGMETAYSSSVYVVVGIPDGWFTYFSFALVGVNWVPVGESISREELSPVNMASYEDILYLAVPQNISDNEYVTELFAYSYPTKHWDSVGSSSGVYNPFSPELGIDNNGNVYIPGLEIDAETEEIALALDCYHDGDWNTLEESIILPDLMYDMALDSSGLYVAYQEDDDIVVEKSTATGWEQLPSVQSAEYKEYPFLTFDNYGDLYLSYTYAGETDNAEGFKIMKYNDGDWELISERTAENPALSKIEVQYNESADEYKIYLGWNDLDQNARLEIFSDNGWEVLKSGFNYQYNDFWPSRPDFVMNYGIPCVIDRMELPDEDAYEVKVSAYVMGEWVPVGTTGLNSSNSSAYFLYASGGELYLAYYGTDNQIKVLKYVGPGYIPY